MTISQISSGPPAPKPRISRRAILKGSAALAMGAAALPLAHSTAVEQSVAGTSSGPLGKGKVIDCHAHLNHRSRATWEADDRKLIEAADKLGIDQLCCSILTPRKPATAEGFQECNRWMAEGMRRFPGRVLGYCYVNPGYGREALEEIRRCVEDRGFIGIKLYNEYTCTEPVVFPIVELAIELGVPILQHASHSHYFVEDKPRMSDGGHLAELARRYPEAMLICAHISGGGDWEWTIKALRHAPNVLLDTSGSVTDEGTVDMAVAMVGVERVVFGCDSSMTAGVGKIRGANISAQDKQKILSGNMMRLLRRRKS
ncbi:MAG TPA: amidohydrolase family protein [Sedimentisphaerales bacterium]|nr:amidohydrolase family protein [Sedimentisphaerales bacterium]